MGIWIRAQNKESLCCTNKVGYMDCGTYQRKGHHIVDADETNRAYIGEYSTKERALQVLDEIQKHIQDFERSKFLTMENADFVNPVFEMPAE